MASGEADSCQMINYKWQLKFFSDLFVSYNGLMGNHRITISTVSVSVKEKHRHNLEDNKIQSSLIN